MSRVHGTVEDSGPASVLPQNLVDPVLDGARIQTIVIVVAAESRPPSLTLVTSTSSSLATVGLGFRKMPPPESPEHT
jgi:hypothetical protein